MGYVLSKLLRCRGNRGFLAFLGSLDAPQDQGVPVAGLNPGLGQTDFACFDGRRVGGVKGRDHRRFVSLILPGKIAGRCDKIGGFNISPQPHMAGSSCYCGRFAAFAQAAGASAGGNQPVGRCGTRCRLLRKLSHPRCPDRPNKRTRRRG